MTNWWDWQERIQACRGYEVEQDLHELQIILGVFIRNHEELQRAVQNYRDPEFGSVLWPREKWDFKQLDDFVLDVTRMLHNYVASAGTLVDHARIWVEKYEGTGFRSNYEDRKNALFADAPLHHFVKDLRNLILHSELPTVTASSPGLQLHLNRAELLATKQFGVKASQFLEAQEARFPLRPIVDEYTGVVRGFHDWIREDIERQHGSELVELADLRAEFKRSRTDKKT